MSRLIVIGTSVDTASSLLYSSILSLFIGLYEDKMSECKSCGHNNKICFNELSGLMFQDIDFIIVNESLLQLNIDFYSHDYDSICFLSKHAAKSGNNSITMHAIGNFDKALFGGEDHKIVVPDSKLLSSFYHSAINRNIITTRGDYIVSLEATHHGPFSEKKCVFYELGSTEKNWNDIGAVSEMSQIFIEALKMTSDKPSFFGIGSNHYCKGFDSLLETYDFAGSCPDYMLSSLNENHLKLISSFADKIIFHNNVKKSEKQRIKEALIRLSIPFEDIS